MKRKVLAVLVPVLLSAGAANAAEIYNKNSNKLDLYGKMVGKHIWNSSGDNNSDNVDDSYARFGIKGETQISNELTGFGQFEHNLNASAPEGQQDESTRLSFAGLKFGDFGSFDYGRNYGVAYDAGVYTDMFVEWGADSWVTTDNFMTGRTTGVATYRNSDFFGEVEGLDFALQYQGKNHDDQVKKANGDGYSTSLSYTFDGFSVVGVYGKSDRTDMQSADGYGDTAEIWSLAAKYDANDIYAAVLYGESRNMTWTGNTIGFANKTQNVEAVVQYQFDFGLRPSLGYVYSKGKDLGAKNGVGGVDADRVNYIEAGAWYYFNKNMNVYSAYKFNLLDDEDAAITGSDTDDQFVMGIVYQF
ncbi:porin [Enterobacteriaceae bacterium H4N4]|uniref:Porin n=1 Tax=Silvania confinis TaxID=2926470 RepID=A0A9J6QIP0_9ENTR|nr:porin [Silvania confinis]MCU6670115.1 porin [Silvania confinis]